LSLTHGPYHKGNRITKNKKMVSHNTLHSRCWFINTVNTDSCKALKQRTRCSCFHSSSYRNPEVGEKWSHSNIRFWSNG